MLTAHTASSLAIPVLRARTPGVDLVRARELSATTVLVTGFGEIDAASASSLGEHRAPSTRPPAPVLDLSRPEFFGTAGYSVLLRVHSRCARAGVDWVLVPGLRLRGFGESATRTESWPTAPNIVSAVAARARPHPSVELRPRRIQPLRSARVADIAEAERVTGITAAVGSGRRLRRRSSAATSRSTSESCRTRQPTG